MNEQLLKSKLKSRMIAVDSLTMPNELFLYSIGYNSAISSILIDIVNGEFDDNKADGDKLADVIQKAGVDSKEYLTKVRI